MMKAMQRTKITIETTVAVPVKQAWELWTLPEHITQWNFASDAWRGPTAQNDLRAGGRFSARMEAKDGSMGFDFGGQHDRVTLHQQIDSTMEDGRKMSVVFSADGDKTRVVEIFEAEETNSVELQRDGWQTILNNFKKYAEASR